MGACDIYFTVAGTLSVSDIRHRLKLEREENAILNGHQEGYSGDWQAISDISFPSHPTFNCFDEAYNWCVENVEKWSGVGVKYKNVPKHSSAKLDKLQDKIKQEKNKYTNLAYKIEEQLLTGNSKLLGCKKCGSKLTRSYLIHCYCPICKVDLRAESKLDKLSKQRAKVNLAQASYDKEKEKLNAKHAKKAESRWLVYGVAAC